MVPVTIILLLTAGTQLAQISASDSTWSGGGIGYDAYMSGGGTAYVDAVVMAAGYKGLDGVPPVIDDFEDGSLSEYTGASSTDWGVVSGNAFEGTYAATAPSNSGIIYNSGYTNERGDTLETRVYLGTSNGVASGIEFWFCTNSDASEKYVHYVSAENGKHFIFYRNGDSGETLDYNNDLTVPSDEWLRLKVTTDSSTIRTELYDSDGNLLSRLASSDSRLSSGGYGFQDEWQTQNSPVYVDQVRGD